MVAVQSSSRNNVLCVYTRFESVWTGRRGDACGEVGWWMRGLAAAVGWSRGGDRGRRKRVGNDWILKKIFCPPFVVDLPFGMEEVESIKSKKLHKVLHVPGNLFLRVRYSHNRT